MNSVVLYSLIRGNLTYRQKFMNLVYALEQMAEHDTQTERMGFEDTQGMIGAMYR